MLLKDNKKTSQPSRRQNILSGRIIIAAISIAWALFQLALPRLIILDSTTVRAVHLAFAITLVFLTRRFRAKKKRRTDFSDEISRIPVVDYILAAVACLSVLYFVFDWTGCSLWDAEESGRGSSLNLSMINTLWPIFTSKGVSTRKPGPASSVTTAGTKPSVPQLL